jgi:hypothetical protein
VDLLKKGAYLCSASILFHNPSPPKTRSSFNFEFDIYLTDCKHLFMNFCALLLLIASAAIVAHAQDELKVVLYETAGWPLVRKVPGTAGDFEGKIQEFINLFIYLPFDANP